jgi:hypothetical protein
MNTALNIVQMLADMNKLFSDWNMADLSNESILLLSTLLILSQ